MPPLVSVITPTLNRHDLLISRCIPSVRARTWPATEHIVVSDGPDPDLPALLADLPVRYGESEHGGHWGHLARLKGITMARGEYIAWLDDDDAYRPQHLKVLVTALEQHPECDFAYSRMFIGAQHLSDPFFARFRDDPDECCGTGGARDVLTSMIVHRASLLSVATWQHTESRHPDSDLVRAWVNAGIGWISVPQVTVDMWTHD